MILIARHLLKNQFFHPGKMVWIAPKLEQFRGKFQFWSSRFVPNCPNWPKSQIYQGLDSLGVFRKKTPSPYGRGCLLARFIYSNKLRRIMSGTANFGDHTGRKAWYEFKDYAMFKQQGIDRFTLLLECQDVCGQEQNGGAALNTVRSN